MIFLAVACEPVNMIFATSSFSTIAAPTSPAPLTVLRIPAGKTSFISRTISSVPIVVCSEGLSTTVLPMRSAGMTCQIAIISGQFHGVIAPTTPRGRRCNSSRRVSSSKTTSSGISSESGTCVHPSTASISNIAPGPASGLPCSRTIHSARYVWFWAKTSTRPMSVSTRSLSVFDAQLG